MILLYHNIIPDIVPEKRWCIGQALPQMYFRHHMMLISRYFHIVSLDEYLNKKKRNGVSVSRDIAITFDDGLRSSFEYASPILKELNIPATFFVTTSHLEDGDPLWFSYLNALCFEDIFHEIKVNNQIIRLCTLDESIQARKSLETYARASGDPVEFCKQLANAYPLPSDIKCLYQGMKHSQLEYAGRSGLIEIGSHSVTHPYLNHKIREEQQREVFESKLILTELTRKPVNYFAYPGGNYNEQTLVLTINAGYEAAFSMIPDRLNKNPHYEIGRVGLYSPSMVKLLLKIFGVDNIRTKLQLFRGIKQI